MLNRLISLRDRIPGGPDGRRMLWINLIDKTGSGLWVSATALYFTVVGGLSLSQVGLLLGAAGAFGVAGAPVIGRLADRLPLTRLILTVQIARAAASLLLLVAHGFWQLLPLVALGSFGERAASVLTKLYAARVAGPDRARYQAVQRTVVNIGYTLGGLAASAGLAFATTAVYRGLLLGDALSFCVVALLVARCAEPPSPARTVTGSGRQPARPAPAPHGGPRNPWRDGGYLAFTGLETLLLLDGSVCRVGLPLWIISSTTAPRGLAPLLFVLNTLLVVAFQVRLSRYGRTPRIAATTLGHVGLCYLIGGAAMAASVAQARWAAIAALIAAATAFTFVEMLEATASWELSIALAPAEAQGAYLGVQGLAQSAERALGPMLLTTLVIASGPLGWAGFGAALATTAYGQRALVRRRLDRMEAATSPHRHTALSVPPVTVTEQ
ncbi:MFS transporter [Streptomyces sp. NBC_01537]|uniref:MFS transporter n=1 Tax=Streptomyces sp. NBC_01537 TaxID=2903896 RepID=UPI003864A816